MLHRTNMLNAKPYASPAISTGKISKHVGKPLADATEYRSLVGALQYLTHT